MTMAAGAEPLGHHPALDGLRAVAVTLVVLSHVHPSALEGGRLGVDLFFALSGFLITTLLLEEAGRTRRLDLARFYGRRAVRLAPALAAVLLVTGAWVLLRWGSIDVLARQAGASRLTGRTVAGWYLAAGTYTTNLTGLLGDRGNFLGHTWSLGVEEQFYLLWPVVLGLAIARRRERALLLACGALVVLFVALRLAPVRPVAGMLAQRPDAVVAGCFASLLRARSIPASARRGPPVQALGAGSLALVLVLAVAVGHGVDDRVLERGGYSVVAAAAALLVWSLVTAPVSPLARLLASRPLVAVGVASYSIYLWHLPVFRFVAWQAPGAGGVALVAARLVVAAAVAVAGHLLVERPTRRWRRRFAPPAAATR